MGQICIRKLIAHDIDLNQHAPSPAQKVIDLSTTPTDVLDFFQDHIMKAHTTKQMKVCRFTRNNAQVMMDCMDVAVDVTNEDKFVSASASMTHRLFTIMKSSTSKSSGALIYLIYEDLNDSTYYLGIMKMDPNKGIQYNKANNSFIVQADMLPSVKDRLHKTAFVKLKGNLWDESVHLFVLDKQQTNESVSKFFLGTFLEAEEKANDELMTKLVEKKLLEMARNQSITPNINMMEFNSKIDRMLSLPREIDLDHELDSLLKVYIPGEDDREAKIDEIKHGLKKENEEAYFEFTPRKKPTIAEYSNPQSKIKFTFPIALRGTKVFVDTHEKDGKKVTTIRIEDTDLIENFR